jgi:hypothetical protein
MDLSFIDKYFWLIGIALSVWNSYSTYVENRKNHSVQEVANGTLLTVSILYGMQSVVPFSIMGAGIFLEGVPNVYAFLKFDPSRVSILLFDASFVLISVACHLWMARNKAEGLFFPKSKSSFWTRNAFLVFTAVFVAAVAALTAFNVKL